MRLSLCMIVRDEEEFLPHCLQSVQTLVDEMIIVDTGSTDRTIEIAREFNAQVCFFEWCNDFSAARNRSLSYAQGDWILVLDADETLVPENLPLLKQIIQQPNYLAVNLVREEIGAAQTPYSLVSRLFRKHPLLSFSRPYHELIDDSVAQILQQEPDWQVVELPQVMIQHQGYRPETIAARNKTARAQTVMAGYLAEHPQDAYICSKLGALYVQTGALTEGLALLERGLQYVQEAGPLTYELHYHLGLAYCQSGNPTRAELHYQAALQQPVLPQLKLGAYNNLGDLLQARGDFAGAQTAFQNTIEIEPGFALGHYNLALVLKRIGRFWDAITCYREAIRLNPAHAESYQNLGVVLLKVGQVPESLTAFRQAIALYEQQQSPEANRLRQGLQDLGLPL